jgi:hypothetical protein
VILTQQMKNKLLILLLLLLVPFLSFGQYKRHYKQPKELSKGAMLTIGGVIFTASPLISEITRYGKPFKNDKGITPNKVAFGCGITVTMTGLITLIAEKK